jgi:uncharacterized ubiquitin-like protein YukD
MADEFTTDTTQWAIAEEGVYVENPEFIAVYIDREGRIIKAIKTDGTEMLAAGLEVHGDISTDGTDITMIENPEFAAVWLNKDKKIFFGIQNNGNFFFGCGVPLQIIHYIEKKISDLSLDEYETIVAFIGDLLNSEETLQTLLNKKVDKKDGKSLIDEGYADGIHYEENPEFVDVETDSEGKILEARGNDGTKIFETDVRVKGGIETKHYVTKNVDCPEYLEVEIDNKGKILSGTHRDGSHYIHNVMSESLDRLVEKEEGKELVSSELVRSLYISESPEHTELVIDKDKRIISSRDNEGGLKEHVSVETPKISTDVSSEYGIEDKEGRLDILFDNRSRIISFRDKDGILHEEVGVKQKL